MNKNGTYEYKRYMRDGSTKTVTAVIRARTGKKKAAKQK